MTSITIQPASSEIEAHYSGLDRLSPQFSLRRSRAQADDLCRYTTVLAAAAFAAIDLAYHLMVLPLKLVRAVVWTAVSSLAWSLRLVGISRPLEALHFYCSYSTSFHMHIGPIVAAAVALVAYPVVGLFSTERIRRLHEALGPAPSKSPVAGSKPAWWKDRKTAIAVAVLGFAAIAAAGLYVRNRSDVDAVKDDQQRDEIPPVDVSKRPWKPRLLELHGNLVPALSISAYGSLVLLGTALERRGYTKTAKMAMGVAVAVFVISAWAAMHSWGQERLAHQGLEALCKGQDPATGPHLSCTFEEVEKEALNLRASPEFVASHLGKKPATSLLGLGELSDLDALRALYGDQRDLSPEEIQALGEQFAWAIKLRTATAWLFGDARQAAVARAQVWQAQSTVSAYLRERGTLRSQLLQMGANLLRFGHFDGESYAQRLLRELKENGPLSPSS